MITRSCDASYLLRSGLSLPKMLARLSWGGVGVGVGVGFGVAASAAIGEPAVFPAAGAEHAVTSGMRRSGSRTESFKRRQDTRAARAGPATNATRLSLPAP